MSDISLRYGNNYDSGRFLVCMLGDENLTLYALALTVFNIVSATVHFARDNGTIKFVSHYLAEGQCGKARETDIASASRYSSRSSGSYWAGVALASYCGVARQHAGIASEPVVFIICHPTRYACQCASLDSHDGAGAECIRCGFGVNLKLCVEPSGQGKKSDCRQPVSLLSVMTTVLISSEPLRVLRSKFSPRSEACRTLMPAMLNRD